MKGNFTKPQVKAPRHLGLAMQSNKSLIILTVLDLTRIPHFLELRVDSASSTKADLEEIQCSVFCFFKLKNIFIYYPLQHLFTFK